MRLIDAEKLIQALRHRFSDEDDFAVELGAYWHHGAVEDVINAQPEAVVRCRDCKHRYEDDCSMRFVEIVQVDDDGYIDHDFVYNDNTTDDGYCNRGERRTDE